MDEKKYPEYLKGLGFYFEKYQLEITFNDKVTRAQADSITSVLLQSDDLKLLNLPTNVDFTSKFGYVTKQLPPPIDPSKLSQGEIISFLSNPDYQIGPDDIKWTDWTAEEAFREITKEYPRKKIIFDSSHEW
jgi:hypothetical protein